MRFADFEKLETVRIGCYSFARIRHPYEPHRLGLILNQAHLARHNRRIYAPVGGTLEVRQAGRMGLPEDCEFESKRSPDDLRIATAGKNARAIVQWFLTRKNRETDVKRETAEELGPEEHGPLTKDELRGLATTFAGYYADILLSRNPNAKVPQTLYLCEVYDTRLPRGIEKLVQRDQTPDSDFRFATPKEIEQQHFNTPRADIGELAVGLLKPSSTLKIA